MVKEFDSNYCSSHKFQISNAVSARRFKSCLYWEIFEYVCIYLYFLLPLVKKSKCTSVESLL